MKDLDKVRTQAIVDFINENCLIESPLKDYMLGKLPGSRYRSQYYLASLLYDRPMQDHITILFYHLVKTKIGHWDFQLAGRDWSAVPLITFLPVLLDQFYDKKINSFMIRSERRNYGLHNWIEGKPNDQPVLLVDDLCNSTNSFIHGYRVCQDVHKLEVLPYIFAVLNKFRPSEHTREIDFDKYLIDQHQHEALYIVDGDDIFNARRVGPTPPDTI